MSGPAQAACRIVRPGGSYHGKQGFDYFEGIARETVGSTGLCMHLLVIPPGGRAKAHKHEHHETAIYVLSGEGHTWHGERLENLAIVKAGEMFYIPAGVPHLPANLGNEPVTAVIARTDPNEQESVVLLPELDELVPARPPSAMKEGDRSRPPAPPGPTPPPACSPRAARPPAAWSALSRRREPG